MTRTPRAFGFPVVTLLAACAGTPSQQPIDAGSGPNPTLPPPESRVIPVVNVAAAKGWSGDELGHDLVPDYMTSAKDGGFYAHTRPRSGSCSIAAICFRSATAAARS